MKINGFISGYRVLNIRGKGLLAIHALCRQADDKEDAVPCNRLKGFSLVEVLIAIALFTTGGLAAAGMVSSAVKSHELSRTYTNMTCLASGRMEEFMATPFEQLIDADDDGAAGLEDLGGQADGQELMDSYQLSWNVANDSPIKNTTTVRVIVETLQPMHGGTKRMVKLSALKSIQ